MRIYVSVKPNSGPDRIEKLDDVHYKAWVSAPAKQGKANDAIIAVLAEYFNVSKSRVSIHFGKTGRDKIIDIT